MKKVLLSIAVFLMVAFLAGCGSDSSSSGETSEASSHFTIPIPGGKAPIRYEKEMKVGPSGLSGPEPKPVFPKGPAPEFLSFVDMKEGIGELHYEGDRVTIQYVGYDYETHKKFASSWDEGKPFTFTVGKGEAISGWEEGLSDLEGGDQRELVVPPSETQGPFPKGIPKGHAAIFVVEPVPAKKAKGGSSAGAAKKPKWKKVKPQKTQPKVSIPKGPPPKKLVVKDLKQGSGPAAKAGDELEVQYVGVLYRTGKVFEPQWGKPGPHFSFQLGSGSVIPGWEEGLEGIKLGGQRQLTIPPDMAYGNQRTGSIPPNSTLVFVIEAVGIR